MESVDNAVKERHIVYHLGVVHAAVGVSFNERREAAAEYRLYRYQAQCQADYTDTTAEHYVDNTFIHYPLARPIVFQTTPIIIKNSPNEAAAVKLYRKYCINPAFPAKKL